MRYPLYRSPEALLDQLSLGETVGRSLAENAHRAVLVTCERAATNSIRAGGTKVSERQRRQSAAGTGHLRDETFTFMYFAWRQKLSLTQ